MIRTAKVIEVKDQGDRVGLFDKVTIFNEMAKQEMTLQLVTTLRQDALKGLISKESPVGKALLGRRVGDRVQVEVSPELKYWVEIRAIEKGRDDESLEINFCGTPSAPPARRPRPFWMSGASLTRPGTSSWKIPRRRSCAPGGRRAACP